MKSTVYCKDCKHSRRSLLLGWSYAKCKAPQNFGEEPVSGKRLAVVGAIYCENSRRFELDGRCGPDGKWFERTQKPVWLKFISA